MLSKSSTSG